MTVLEYSYVDTREPRRNSKSRGLATYSGAVIVFLAVTRKPAETSRALTGQLTSYTTRHTKISYSLACQCSQVNLHVTPLDTSKIAADSHVNVSRPTHLL
jgi:hypothetical protein